MGDSCSNLDLLQDGKKDKPKPARASWSERQKQILLELLETLNMDGASVKTALDKGISSNDKRHKVWEAVTRHFNLSTSRNDTPDQIRTLYNRMKTDAKNKHDKQIIAAKAAKSFKKSCAQTGGGPGVSMPAEVDGDHYREEHFEGVLDPPANPFATFNAPNSSRDVFPSSELEAAIQSIESVPFDIAGDSYSNEVIIQEDITEDQISVSNNPRQTSAPVSYSQQQTSAPVSYNQQQASAPVSNNRQQASAPVSNNHTRPQNQEDVEEDQAAPGFNNETITLHTIDNEIGTARKTGAASNLTVRRTETVSPITPGKKKPSQTTPRTGRGAGANKKDEAATDYYRKTLKQRTSLARYQKPTAKFKLNLHYMKCKLLENQLLENGVSFELPYKNVEIPSSESDSSDEENNS